MRTLILTLCMLYVNLYTSQTFSPVLEDYNSIGAAGDPWKLVTGQPNAGAHGGQLCYNISGNYIDNQYYSFESDTLDLSMWTSIDLKFSVQSSLRSGDLLILYYLDGADSLWYGWDISNAVGTYTVNPPTTAILFSIDLNTNTNGNVNGKYAHVDYLYINDPGIMLPIELLSFSGVEVDGYNLLNWSTASESNSDYYDIQWSTDAYYWESIGKLEAAGNSNSTIYYEISHHDYDNGVNYYRLVQYDFDGWFEIFDIIAINNKRTTMRVVKYYDFTGRELDRSTAKGLVIGVYSDGTSATIYLN
jgi:hypothetical protein